MLNFFHVNLLVKKIKIHREFFLKKQNTGTAAFFRWWFKGGNFEEVWEFRGRNCREKKPKTAKVFSFKVFDILKQKVMILPQNNLVYRKSKVYNLSWVKNQTNKFCSEVNEKMERKFNLCIDKNRHYVEKYSCVKFVLKSCVKTMTLL